MPPTFCHAVSGVTFAAALARTKVVARGPKPLAVTYEPTGCGKVLYTTFQTANASHVGLYPQERILIYLIMEIQTCSDNPIF